MKKPIIPMTILALASTLAGCASAPVGGPVLEQRVGQALPDDVTASYDPGADTVTVSKNGAGPMTLANSGLVGSATSYASGATLALRQTTASGKGEVVTIGSPDAELGIAGAIATRAGAVDVPGSGTAYYLGGYAGLLVRVSDKAVMGTIPATACLIANFGAGSIGGAIVGRSGAGFADITIPAMPISSGGTFSGAISGGQGSGIGNNIAANGQLSGMFADVGAGEVVGALQLDHTISGTAFYEVGGFTTGPGTCP